MIRKWFNRPKPMVKRQNPFMQTVFGKRLFARDRLEDFGRKFESHFPPECKSMFDAGIPHYRIANVLSAGIKSLKFEATEMRIAYILGVDAYMAHIEGWKVYK